jgi:hypothetical protein
LGSDSSTSSLPRIKLALEQLRVELAHAPPGIKRDGLHIVQRFEGGEQPSTESVLRVMIWLLEQSRRRRKAKKRVENRAPVERVEQVSEPRRGKPKRKKKAVGSEEKAPGGGFRHAMEKQESSRADDIRKILDVPKHGRVTCDLQGRRVVVFDGDDHGG